MLHKQEVPQDLRPGLPNRLGSGNETIESGEGHVKDLLDIGSSTGRERAPRLERVRR